MEVPWSEASRFGLMVTDDNDRISEFQEKPKDPKSNLASMGIYIFNWDVLKSYLIADEADPESENDFAKTSSPPCCATAAACTPTACRLLEGRGHHLLAVAGKHGGPGPLSLRHQPV